jgi:hypothetical protein
MACGTLGLAVVVGSLFDALGDNTLLYTTTGYALALLIAAILSEPDSVSRAAPAWRASGKSWARGGKP